MIDDPATRSGGFRQRSGAIIFPPSPESIRAKETRKELDKELSEVKALKEELNTLLEIMKDKQ